MIFSHRQLLAVLVLLNASEAFQLPVNKLNVVSLPKSACSSGTSTTACLSHVNSDDNEGPERQPRGGLRKIFSKLKKPVAFLTPLLVASSAVWVGAPQTAHASAPVMAMPKADVRDPGIDALENHERKMTVKAQDELRQMNLRARQIEAKEGGAARETFERGYKEDQERMAKERLENIEKLKYELLDQGICPFIDIEGQRQVLTMTKGIDLGEVAGTPFHLEREFEKKSPQKSHAYKKQANRAILKCMVDDMKNRDIDPLEYFENHQLKILNILELPAAQAAALATKYQENLDLYGQIAPPKEGEMSAKEQMAQKGKGSSASKDEAKRLKAEAKAKAAAEKADSKAKAKEEKERAKAAKEASKKEKEATKAAVAAAATAAAVAASSAVASTAAAAELVASTAAEVVEGATEMVESVTADGESSPTAIATTDKPTSVAEKKSKGIPIIPVSAVLVAVGGGGYAVKMVRDKTASDEEERQRQFQLLMGGLEDESTSSPSSFPALEEVDTGLSDYIFEDEKARASIEEEKPVETAPKKKKKRGLKMFGKKKNGRDTDINSLVSADAKSPEFAKLLANILTFGAPGRFPDVLALSGEMPMQEFEFEAASEMLVKAQESASLSKEDAAEVFANVVNCMLIDIVDLASTSLKEKDNKVMVDAISIVVDFMNHAASLYNSIAEGVVITPVTYGGDMGKGKLEQMYSAYAVSGMTNFANVDENFDNRVSLLQDVFQINEKKAEGLMMKSMQKNMMEMMKSGEGMEGMEEMMKGMGGMEGMDGLAGGLPGMGDGEEPSPEQLKEMLYALKELKDSGSIPESELKEVKKQFRDAFGSSIGDVMKDADKNEGELGSQDKELLDLMKSILD